MTKRAQLLSQLSLPPLLPLFFPLYWQLNGIQLLIDFRFIAANYWDLGCGDHLSNALRRLLQQNGTSENQFLSLLKKHHSLNLESDLSLKSQALFIIDWLSICLAYWDPLSPWLVYTCPFSMETTLDIKWGNSIHHLVCIESGGQRSFGLDWGSGKGSQVLQFVHSHVSTSNNLKHFCHYLIDSWAGITC